LSASGGAEGNYKWYESEADKEAIANATGSTFTTSDLSKTKTYYVSAVNSLGCEGGRQPVEARINYMDAVTITVDVSANKLTSSYETGNQWYLNGVLIPGATNKIIEANQSGVYEVEVARDGCSTRAAQEMIVLGIEDKLPKGYNFYPNPVRHQLSIELPSNEPASGVVIRSTGQNVGTLKFNSIGEKSTAEYDFSDHADGMYFLRIKQGKAIVHYKIIKK
jgi:hypothetical protein